MTCRRILLLFALLTLPVAAARAQDLNQELWEAARKGDAAAVRALLDKGADVNAKFRYNATALSYAADKGHTEVVKILIERGADVNVRDTFYQATPLSWATGKGHVAIIQALLDKGAEGVDQVLSTGVRSGNAEMVRVAITKGGLKPEALSAALAAATNGNKTEIAEILKKAGAQPPPEIDAAMLQTYVGKYRGDPGPEISITFKDGKLFAVPTTGQPPIALMALDKTTFRPTDFEGVTVTFNVDGGKVTGFALKQGQNTTQLKKVEQ